jgi:hypothetical protein
MPIKLDSIRIDGETQPREAIDTEVVTQYAEAAQGGANFPPLVVFADGKDYWLADGFHRYHAFRQVGSIGADCEVRKGTRVDALRFALGANATHGLRRTRADLARAIRLAYENRAELGLPDVPSARAVAELVGCNHETAGNQLAEIASWRGAPARTGADGKTRAVRDFGPPPTARPAPGGTPWPPPARDVNLDVTVRDEDKRGVEVTPETEALWARRAEVQRLLAMISEVRVTLDKAQTDDDPLYAGGFLGQKLGNTPVNFSQAKAHLDQAYATLKEALPEYVCPMCHGISGCRSCSGNGLISQFRWDTIIPREAKG